MDLALVASRFVHDATLAFVAGALLFPLYALGGADRAGWSATDPLGGAVRWGAGLALASGVAEFAATAAAMAGEGRAALDPATLLLLATQTQFGWVWGVRLAILAALCILLAAAPARRGPALALSLAALAGLALVGHARSRPGLAGVAHVTADAIHLLTAALWTGGLPALLVVLARSDMDAPRALGRFSGVAAPAVALLVTTGALASWLLAGSPLALGATAWGRLLLLKVALVAAMGALAALNRWRLARRLAEEGSAGGLRLSIGAESALAVLVFAAVAWLGVLSPTG